MACTGDTEATLKSSANDVFKVAISTDRLNPYGLARAP